MCGQTWTTTDAGPCLSSLMMTSALTDMWSTPWTYQCISYIGTLLSSECTAVLLLQVGATTVNRFCSIQQGKTQYTGTDVAPTPSLAPTLSLHDLRGP